MAENPIAIDSDEPSRKKRKVKPGKDNERIPTREELTQLKENETLFQSTLLRLQIEELLSEVKVTDQTKSKFQKWYKKLRNELLSHPTVDVDMQTLTENQEYNFAFASQLKSSIKINAFTFHPPEDVQIVGGFPLDLCIKSSITADVMVHVPKKCFQNDDCLNLRYHFKRAIYLACLANHLRESDLVESVDYEYFHGDHLKPVILITPKGKLGKNMTVKILACPPNHCFKISRFVPQRNNIRSSWYHGSEVLVSNPPTPLYNSSILFDILTPKLHEYLNNTIGNKQAICNGIVLLKVWLHQRELDQGFGAITNFILTMYVGHLLVKKKLHALMSSYQVARNTLLALSQSNWLDGGITLAAEDSEDLPLIDRDDFNTLFPVVVIDPSGYLNLCATVEKHTFLRLKHEAELAVKLLETADNFEALFMTRMPFIRTFDHCIKLAGNLNYDSAIVRWNLRDKLLDCVGNERSVILPPLVETLHRGFGKRVDLIDVQFLHPLKWKTNEKPPASTTEIIIGFLLNHDHGFSVLDKGPSAETPEAKEFRSFWGSKSEMRRFKDTSVCEAVAWPCQSFAEKRMVCSQVASHLLKRHFSIPSVAVHYIGGQLDCVLSLPPHKSWPENWPPYGTGEEVTANIIETLDHLRTELQSLQDLPLTITSVQGIAPSFSYTEVFPPLHFNLQEGPRVGTRRENHLIPKEGLKKAPNFVPALEVLIAMEGSNKWPNNFDAVLRIKAAFYLKLAKLLEEVCGLICTPTMEHVDVLKDGYVFRLIIGYKREPTLLKMERSSDGLSKLVENEKASILEKTTIHLPKLRSTLHGLHLQQSTFSSACRLAKRWVSSQLLADHVSDTAVELLMAHVYISNSAFTTPKSPQVAFQRWLHLISTHDWKTLPLIVNLNGELTPEDLAEIQANFSSTRANRPPLFIATSCDKFTSSWTRNAPTMPLFHRFVKLTKGALEVFEKQLLNPSSGVDKMQIFLPSMAPYDVVIKLNILQVPLCHHGIAVNGKVKPLIFRDPLSQKDSKMLPIVDYNPVAFYLEDLKAHFDEFAVFCYDKYGGDKIAVLWKPDAFSSVPFKVSHINGKCVKDGDVNEVMAPNVQNIIEQFEVLGLGLVKSIESNLEKWKID